MRRRDFIAGIVGSAVAWSFAARAQQPKLPRIAFSSRQTQSRSGTSSNKGCASMTISRGKPSSSSSARQKESPICYAGWPMNSSGSRSTSSSPRRRRPLPRQGRRLRKFQSSWRRQAIQSEWVSSPAWRGRAATSPDCPRPPLARLPGRFPAPLADQRRSRLRRFRSRGRNGQRRGARRQCPHQPLHAKLAHVAERHRRASNLHDLDRGVVYVKFRREVSMHLPT